MNPRRQRRIAYGLLLLSASAIISICAGHAPKTVTIGAIVLIFCTLLFLGATYWKRRHADVFDCLKELEVVDFLVLMGAVATTVGAVAHLSYVTGKPRYLTSGWLSFIAFLLIVGLLLLSILGARSITFAEDTDGINEIEKRLADRSPWKRLLAMAGLFFAGGVTLLFGNVSRCLSMLIAMIAMAIGFRGAPLWWAPAAAIVPAAVWYQRRGDANTKTFGHPDSALSIRRLRTQSASNGAEAASSPSPEGAPSK